MEALVNSKPELFVEHLSVILSLCMVICIVDAEHLELGYSKTSAYNSPILRDDITIEGRVNCEGTLSSGHNMLNQMYRKTNS